MKLSLRTQGGITGPAGAVVREVDTDQLPEASRKEALRLLAEAKLFERPAKALLASPRPEDFRHQLHVADDDKRHQIDFQLRAVDEPMQKLIEWIEDEVPPKSDFHP
jgi:hypothetical protein